MAYEIQNTIIDMLACLNKIVLLLILPDQEQLIYQVGVAIRYICVIIIINVEETGASSNTILKKCLICYMMTLWDLYFRPEVFNHRYYF